MFKKISASVLAGILVFGSVAVFPQQVFDKGIPIVAAEQSGFFEYAEREEGQIEIIGYTGNETDITIPATINGMRVTAIRPQLFAGNTTIESVVLPDGLLRINHRAFADCTSLRSVKIPDSVVFIAAESFDNCTSLSEVSIPKNIEDIGGGAFRNTKIVNDQTTEVKYLDNWVIGADDNITTANIKNGTYGIAGDAFKDHKKLTSVTLPDGLNTIKFGAFSGCSALEKINLPGSLVSLERAFDDTKLTASADGNVTYIDGWAVAVNADAESISIKKGTKGFSSNLFSWCEKLKSVTLPEGTTTIPAYMLAGCSALESVNIPDGTKTIGECAFTSCPNLKSVTVPASVNTIGMRAFGYYTDEEWREYMVEGFTVYCTSGSAAEQYAKDNNIKYELLDAPAHTHAYTSKVTKKATCTADGVKTYTCECGDSYTEAIKAAGHKYTTKIVKPTYDAQGYTLHTCSVCGKSYKDTYTDKLTRTSIAKAKITGLSDKTYTGKAIKQTPVVKLGKKTLKAGTDYTVSYKNNKAVGTATVTITGKGAYTGTAKATFKINPKKTTLKKATSPKTKKLKVTYSKVSGVTGYQVTYSTSKKFTKKTTKSVNVKGTSKTITGLKKGKTYYVKVRSYKTVGKTKYYSGYSAVKKIIVK